MQVSCKRKLYRRRSHLLKLSDTDHWSICSSPSTYSSLLSDVQSSFLFMLSIVWPLPSGYHVLKTRLWALQQQQSRSHNYTCKVCTRLDPDQQRVFVSHSQTLEANFLAPPFLFTDMTSNWVRQLPHPSPSSPSSLGHTCWSCTCWRLWKGWVWTRLHRTLYKKKLTILPSLPYGFLDLEVLFH